MPNQLDLCTELARLHSLDLAWIIPNVWDVQSAKRCEQAGFKALATTSAGLADTLGKADSTVTLNEKLQHCRDLTEAVGVPVSVDFEDGFADSVEGVQANLERLITTGVAGASIEDFDRQRQEILEFSAALERVQAAVEVIRRQAIPFQLIARAEGLLRGTEDLDQVIARLAAFAEAGADMVYAPALSSLDQIRQVRAAVSTPINFLVPFLPSVTLEQLTAVGVNRVSLGAALYRYAQRENLAVAEQQMLAGHFSWLR